MARAKPARQRHTKTPPPHPPAETPPPHPLDPSEDEWIPRGGWSLREEFEAQARWSERVSQLVRTIPPSAADRLIGLAYEAEHWIELGEFAEANTEMLDLAAKIAEAQLARYRGRKATPDAPSVTVRIRSWCQRLVTRHTPKVITQRMLWQALERRDPTGDRLIARAMTAFRREDCMGIPGHHQGYHVHLTQLTVGVSLRTFQNEVATLSAAARRTRRNLA
jgi:hypothetical protein